MKFQNVFLSLFVLLLLTSCNKDENSDSQISTSKLVGTWNLKDIRCNDCKSVTEISGQISTNTFTISSKDVDAEVNISENPNTYASMGSYTAITKLNVGGQTSTFEVPLSDFSDSGTWQLNGSKFIVTSTANGMAEYDIVKLNNTSFEYKYLVNIVEDSGVYKVTTTGTYFATLEKK